MAGIQWTPARGMGEAMASATGSGQQQSPSTAAAADADPGAGTNKLVFEAAPQPMREDYIENAVKFLSHPKVRGSSTTGGDVPLVCLRGEYLALLGSYSHNLRAHRFEPRSAASQLEYCY